MLRRYVWYDIRGAGYISWVNTNKDKKKTKLVQHVMLYHTHVQYTLQHVNDITRCCGVAVKFLDDTGRDRYAIRFPVPVPTTCSRPDLYRAVLTI